MGKKSNKYAYQRYFFVESEFLEIDADKIDAATIKIGKDNQALFCHSGEEIPYQPARGGIRYDGKNKPKTVFECPINTGLMRFDIAEELAHFDIFFAIDTNTQDINGERLSCCVTVKCLVERNFVDGRIAFGGINFCNCMLVAGMPGNPETSAWRHFLEHLSEVLGADASTLRIGLIVDSEQGDHADFNKRAKPIHDGFYLPENVTLIYASTDRGASELNRLMRVCHKASDDKLDEIRKSGISWQEMQRLGIKSPAPNIQDYKEIL